MRIARGVMIGSVGTISFLATLMSTGSFPDGHNLVELCMQQRLAHRFVVDIYCLHDDVLDVLVFGLIVGSLSSLVFHRQRLQFLSFPSIYQGKRQRFLLRSTSICSKCLSLTVFSLSLLLFYRLTFSHLVHFVLQTLFTSITGDRMVVSEKSGFVEVAALGQASLLCSLSFFVAVHLLHIHLTALLPMFVLSEGKASDDKDQHRFLLESLRDTSTPLFRNLGFQDLLMLARHSKGRKRMLVESQEAMSTLIRRSFGPLHTLSLRLETAISSSHTPRSRMGMVEKMRDGMVEEAEEVFQEVGICMASIESLALLLDKETHLLTRLPLSIGQISCSFCSLDILLSQFEDKLRNHFQHRQTVDFAHITALRQVLHFAIVKMMIAHGVEHIMLSAQFPDEEEQVFKTITGISDLDFN